MSTAASALITGVFRPLVILLVLSLGQGLSTYIYQILQYLNFNSDYQPYPFGAWPKGEPRSTKLEAPTDS